MALPLLALARYEILAGHSYTWAARRTRAVALFGQRSPDSGVCILCLVSIDPPDAGALVGLVGEP